LIAAYNNKGEIKEYDCDLKKLFFQPEGREWKERWMGGRKHGKKKKKILSDNKY
jgi:hypothetical protein